MKKFLAVLLALMLCVGFAACSAQKTEDAEEEKERIGMLTQNNISEEELKKTYGCEHFYFDNLTDMEMALTGGTIDRITIGESTAKYIVAKDDALVRKETPIPTLQNYSMLLSEKNQPLCDQISGAINKLEENGTLAELQKKYINGVINEDELEAVTLPNFDGAETIKVAVTGDLPPMDYVTADGKAAGFNVALLKAISEELKVNIELVQVNAGARAVALSSGKADVVFWTLNPEFNVKEIANKAAKDDIPENTVQTVPYFSESVVLVVCK